MSKFLVTGGLGLIGHNVVRRLRDREHETVIMDIRTNYGIIPQAELDYLMAERLRKIDNHEVYNTDICLGGIVDFVVEKERPNVIIHCASFPRQKVVNANPAWGADVMMRGLINLLESAKKHGVERFVYISSSMVYGDFKDDVGEEDNCHPQGQYGIMKLMGEDLVRDYTHRGHFNHTIIRPSAVYGEYDIEDRVVSKFMLAAMRDQTLKVNGASETLDFTYVEDAAAGIVGAALSENARNNTYNITKSHSWSLLDAANLAVAIAGKGTVEVRDKDADFPSRGALNIDAARRDFGYDPKVDVEEGFLRYYQWFRESPYWQANL